MKGAIAMRALLSGVVLAGVCACGPELNALPPGQIENTVAPAGRSPSACACSATCLSMMGVRPPWDLSAATCEVM